MSIHTFPDGCYSSNRTGPGKRTVNKRCGNGGTCDNTHHMSESSRSGVSLLARGGCPLESRYPIENHHALLFTTTLLSSVRAESKDKQGWFSQAPRYLTECSAQQESQGNLFLRDLCQPNIAQRQVLKSLYMCGFSWFVFAFLVLMPIRRMLQYIYEFTYEFKNYSFGPLELCLCKRMNCKVLQLKCLQQKSVCSLCNWDKERMGCFWTLKVVVWCGRGVFFFLSA